MPIDSTRRSPPLCNRPDDERLTAAGISGDEHVLEVRPELTVPADVSALVQI
jgi:hypothetical protein